MNRYEELAVAQDVSLEEIHQAYQALARLLHPDNQSDPKLKSAAERQMIRLNEILVHEARGSRSSPPPQPIPMLPLKRQLPWILACGILVGVGLWYLRSNEAGDPPALGRSVQSGPNSPS